MNSIVWLMVLLNTAGADSVTVSFTDPSAIEQTNAVYNQALGRVHAPFHVQYSESGPTVSRAVDVGNGSDGAFDSLTNYLRFHDGPYLGDGVIVINTNAHPNLQFTRFVLLNGFKLVGRGSQPLIIRSQSIVDLQGNAWISCNGSDGDDVNADPSVRSLGGAGRCGGQNGGDGETLSLPAMTGLTPSANASGGGGIGGSEGDGGGGGGAFSQTISDPKFYGVSVTGSTGGAPGSSVQDDAFTSIQGGAGGGGGRMFTSGTASQNSSGAGGGAGGGVIVIHSAGQMTVASSAQITADGGSGGDAPSRFGGAGGAGGGGSIQIFVGGSFTLDGSVSATGGPGGVSIGGDAATSIPGDSGRTAGDGGNGAVGRTWLVDNCSGACIGGTGPITPGSLLLDFGKTSYIIGIFTAETKLIDTRNSLPGLSFMNLVSSVTGSSHVQLEAASSADSFSVSQASWLASTQLTDLSGRRYFRFRVTLDNQDDVNSAYAESVSFGFEPYRKSDFDLKPGCGLVQGAAPPTSGLWGAFLLPLLIYSLLRATSASRRKSSN